MVRSRSNTFASWDWRASSPSGGIVRIDQGARRIGSRWRTRTRLRRPGSSRVTMDASDGGDPVWDDIEKNWIWTYEDDEVDRAFAEFDEREILSPLTIDELVVARANFAQWKPPASLSV